MENVKRINVQFLMAQRAVPINTTAIKNILWLSKSIVNLNDVDTVTIKCIKRKH